MPTQCMLAFATPTADKPMFMTYCDLGCRMHQQGLCLEAMQELLHFQLRGTTPEPAGIHTAGEAPPAKAADVGNWNAVNPVVSTSMVIEETVAGVQLHSIP
jgi:hypothetical protein